VPTTSPAPGGMATDSHLMSCLNCGHEIPEDARFCPRCGAAQTTSRDGGVREGALAVIKSPAAAGNQYLRALGRFWWLLVLGLGVAAIAAILAVYRVSFSPLGLEKKDQPTYTASSRLLITSAEQPYVRTRITQEQTVGGEVQEYSTPPDIGTLITAANLYPVLIESDEVANLREEMAGPLPGAITTRAIYEVNSPSRFELSQIPVIEVFGHAGAAGDAVAITRATVDAFKEYIQRAQNSAGLSRSERVLVQEIQEPAGAAASGGGSLSLPLMLFVVVAAAFFALAILLDRLFPVGIRLPLRGRAAPAPASEAALADVGSEPERRPRRSKARA
jgi:zinc-ribbon domain